MRAFYSEQQRHDPAGFIRSGQPAHLLQHELKRRVPVHGGIPVLACRAAWCHSGTRRGALSSDTQPPVYGLRSRGHGICFRA